MSIEIPIDALAGFTGPSGWFAHVSAAGWYATVVTPRGAGEVVYDILCAACGPKILPPALVAHVAAERRR